jgi:hypothetical protein
MRGDKPFIIPVQLNQRLNSRKVTQLSATHTTEIFKTGFGIHSRKINFQKNGFSSLD